MKKIDKWTNEGIQYMQDADQYSCYKLGLEDMRSRIFHMLVAKDINNMELMKNDPKVAVYLLEQIIKDVQVFGEDEE